MATIQNDRDVLLQAAATRLETVTLPISTVVDFASQVVGAAKPANNADVTTNILTNSGTAIVMTSAALFKSSSGVGGVFLGAGGLVGKDSGGNVTFSINATTGAAYYGGDITGGSNIDITGSAKFGGLVSVGGTAFGAAFNMALNARGGLWAGAGGTFNAIVGFATGSGAGAGVFGQSTGSFGIGVNGDAPSGVGVQASGTFSLVALGPMSLNNSTWNWNSYTIAAPTGNTTKFLRNDGAWADLTSLLKFVSTAATAGAALGYLIIDTYGAAGQVKVPYNAL